MRNILKFLLSLFTRLALLKHRPMVVAVLGDGATSIVREQIFSILKEKLPTRRNDEVPEAEFSLPLTILDYDSYPQTMGEWLKMLGKVFLQTFHTSPYPHGLVLELSPISTNVQNYWLGLLKPNLIVVVGKETFPVSKTFQIYQIPQVIVLGDQVPGYLAEIGEMLGIEPEDVELGWATVNFPMARWRIFAHPNNATIIDATHYYLPIKLESVWEIAQGLNEKTVVINPSERDRVFLAAQNEGMAQAFAPQLPSQLVASTTYILRGQRTHEIPKYRQLFLQSTRLV